MNYLTLDNTIIKHENHQIYHLLSNSCLLPNYKTWYPSLTTPCSTQVHLMSVRKSSKILAKLVKIGDVSWYVYKNWFIFDPFKVFKLNRVLCFWFYKLVNHGVPETLIKEMMDMSNKFFNMTEEEKLEFVAHGVLDPIRCSTGFNKVNHDKDLLWRDYLRLIVHPVFNCPHKPPGFR